MTTSELIDATRKAIELPDAKFNIVSGDMKLTNNKSVQSWGVEVILGNVIIKLQLVIRQDNDPDPSIILAYKNGRFLSDGKVLTIPIRSNGIDYSVYEELVNIINKKIERTEDDLVQELKSMFREDVITNILK